MNALSQVVLVTTTFSKSVEEMRAQLALKTCRAAKENGYRIIVVDDSPCQEFKAALRETGATVINQSKEDPGMGGSRRQTLKAGVATGGEAIVWIEPEKYPLVPLLGPCIAPVLEDEVDVVIPRRRNLDGYPQYQHLSELRGNWEIGNITGRPDLDLYIGPRVLSPTAAATMAKYDGRCGLNTYGDNWEILFIPILWFLQHRLFVKSIVVDYVHPVEQLVEDDEVMRAKRDKQRIDLVSAMSREAESLYFKGL